jgi:hypothetical protein
MSATLETRVDKLERELDGIKAMVQGKQPFKDWRTTFGMSRDDSAFEELIQLGREFREQQHEEGTPGVDS